MKYNNYLTEGKFTGFDLEHDDFRKVAFMQFMNRVKQKYMGLVRFEGDKQFTLAMQRQLLNLTFDYGTGGIFDYQKHFKEVDMRGFIENEEIYNEIQGLFSIEIFPMKPLGIAPFRWNENERVTLGNGVTSKRHNIGRKSFPTTRENTAYLQFDYTFESGWYKWLAFAYFWSTAQTIAKKRMTLFDKKFVANAMNNSFSDATFQDVYDVTKSFFNAQPAQTSELTGNTKNMNVDISVLLSAKLAKLDMSAGESINDLMNFIDTNYGQWNYLFGIRTNTNKKSDRNITDEFKADEVHFATLQKEVKDQIEIFVEDYERVYGKKLTPIYTEDVILEGIKAQERALSGGGVDNQGEAVNDDH